MEIPIIVELKKNEIIIFLDFEFVNSKDDIDIFSVIYSEKKIMMYVFFQLEYIIYPSYGCICCFNFSVNCFISKNSICVFPSFINFPVL